MRERGARRREADREPHLVLDAVAAAASTEGGACIHDVYLKSRY
jgi:hypothetical protein